MSLVFLALSLALGSVSIPFYDILRILLGDDPTQASWKAIILEIRIPKALTALFAGASLGVAGSMMQTFFRNPLAGPFILGVSAGASLGVALVILVTGTLGGFLLAGSDILGELGLIVVASLGAALSLALVLLVARRVSSSVTLLLVGIMLSSFTSGLVSILLHFSIPERIQAYIRWTFGSFGGVSLPQLPIMMLTLSLGLLLAFTQCKSLDALLLGEDTALSLGVDIQRTRYAILLSAAILGGVVTAYCGPIAFLGLAIPHFCRGITQSADHRTLFWTLLPVGGSAAMLAALVASLPGSPYALPLNAVTALIGVPVVLRLLLSRPAGVAIFTR